MADAFSGLIVLLVWLFVLVLIFAITILPVIWVYSDAQRNSSDSPVMWALIVFFVGPVIGLLLYFVFGRY